MRKRMLIILTVLVSVAVFLYLRWRNEEFIPAPSRTVSIEFSGGDKLYLKAKSWGFAGNNSQIALTRNESSIGNQFEDYLFYTTEVYYKANDSSMVIYAPESSIKMPSESFFHPNVQVIPIKTGEEFEVYQMKFDSLGLKKISVY